MWKWNKPSRWPQKLCKTWSKSVRVTVNSSMSMFYSDSNKLATKSVLMAIDALIADLFDYGNM